MKMYFVYILASKRNGTLYVGLTSNLVSRITQHCRGQTDGFTKRYRVHRLVYYETFRHVQDAIAREKQLKKWKRAWKLRLIEEDNPEWRDLYENLLE